MGGKRLTTKIFIERSKKIHGDKYDYSLVEYMGSRIKVKIICEIHGVFEQIPSSHIFGYGCKDCGGKNKLTKKQFIDKSKQIHGDKYDYSLVEYKNTITKIKIICKDCNSLFYRTPKNHLKGNIKNGCKKCYSIKQKMTNDEFIDKSKQIHGDKYDYSLVEYIGVKNKVKIICSIHGVFEQIPNVHLTNHGCKKCQNDKHRLTTERFIEKSKQIHGDRYDYSLVEYKKTNKDKVKIVCKEHGMFIQSPSDHLYGMGCKKCRIMTTNEFIERLKNKHGDKYDYSKVIYNGAKTKVIIICSKHGEFKQNSYNHLTKYGCPKCGIDKRRLSQSDFIERSKKIHGDKYDYSLVDFVDTNTKVKIICKEHGIFNQTPTSHSHNHGCPSCNESKGEKEVNKFLIKNKILFERQKSFDKCRNILPLSFDFYLPKYNTCIEYDGKQHFEPPIQWGGEKYLKQINKTDNIKNNYCENNNIKLLRIKYTEYDKIENILTGFLKL